MRTSPHSHGTNARYFQRASLHSRIMSTGYACFTILLTMRTCLVQLYILTLLHMQRHLSFFFKPYLKFFIALASYCGKFRSFGLVILFLKGFAFSTLKRNRFAIVPIWILSLKEFVLAHSFVIY